MKSKTTKGRITVAGLVDNRWRNVRLNLVGRDYQTAIKAHNDKEYIEATGDLARHGGSYILTNALRHFLLWNGPIRMRRNPTRLFEYPIGSAEPAMVREDSNPFVDD